MAMLVPAVSRRVAPSTAAQIGMTAAAYPSGAKWCSAIQNESRPTSSASKASRIMSSYSSRCVRAESGGRCVLYMPMPKRIVLSANLTQGQHVEDGSDRGGSQQKRHRGDRELDASPVGDRTGDEGADIADAESDAHHQARRDTYESRQETLRERGHLGLRSEHQDAGDEHPGHQDRSRQPRHGKKADHAWDERHGDHARSAEPVRGRPAEQGPDGPGEKESGKRRSAKREAAAPEDDKGGKEREVSGQHGGPEDRHREQQRKRAGDGAHRRPGGRRSLRS